jgi:DNA-binding transcriptional LysR family regulator
LGQADELTERARVLADGRTAILRVGAAASTIQRIMPRLLARHRKKWAHVESYLIQGGSQSLLPALENGEIDIAITRYATTDVHGACPLFPTHIIAVVGRRHRLAGRATADVSDLANERLLIAPPDTTSRSLFEQACLAERVRPRIVLESHELNSLVAMADGGQGVAIVPSTVDISNYAVNVMALVHDGKPLGSWTSIVRDLRRALPDYVQAFVAEALAGLGRDYPGRELALPPLPAPLRNLAAARA